MVQSEQHVIYRLMAGKGQCSEAEANTEKDCHEWKLTTVDRPSGFQV